ncbi:MAG: 50S ribosomal protein L35 [Acidobacteria bacterium]|nr:50S ribosomal protein L35 [Acidobacteriota bacterium]
MPKMKNHRGAAKRVKRTGSGKFSRHHAYASHLMAHKSSKRKRNLRKSEVVADADQRRLRRLLPKRYS